MQEIAYRSWALISDDGDPANSEATITVAPVITNVAIDRGASLVFELSESFANLPITLSTTALSAGGRDDLCRIYAGSSASDLRELLHLQGSGLGTPNRRLPFRRAVKIIEQGAAGIGKLQGLVGD